MDVTCPNCGAANRDTSRFCARCGEVLPFVSEESKQGGGELNLPWLEGVHDRAVKQTGELSAEKLAEVEEAEAGRAAQSQQPPREQQAQQPAPELEPEDQAQDTEAARPLEETAPAETPQEAAGGGSPDEPPPEWVVGILEPGVTQAAGAKPEYEYEPEEMGHIMPWLTGAPDEGGEAPADTVDTADAASADGLPPWLGDVTVQETLQARNIEPEEATIPEDLLPEIEGLEPFMPPEFEEKPSAKGETPKVGPKTQEKVPDWLKTLAPKLDEEEGVEREPHEIERFTPITKVRLDPSDTLAESVFKSVPVRPPRPGSVETLAALMQAPAGDALRQVAPATARMPGQPGEATSRGASLRQWLLPDGLIYVVVLAALLAVLVLRPPFGKVNAPAASDALEFFRAVEAAPTGKPVLVVYDWDASRSAEMSVLAGAVTHHLMSRRLHFLTISTMPQGPGFAQQITDEAANDPKANYGYQYGRDYLVLGYVPGNEAALNSMMSDFTALLPLDYVKSQDIQSFDIMRGGSIKSLSDFGLVIDLASDEAALRNWIEQVASRTSVPLVAAVPQGLEPMARPYRGIAGAGLKAVVSGQAGAMQYLQQLTDTQRTTASQYSTDALADRLNAQSVAQLLVALAIIGAFVTLGARKVIP